MKKILFAVLLILTISMVAGCSSSEGNTLTGKTTASVSDNHDDSDNPSIDKSYDTKRSDTPSKTTKTATTTTRTTTQTTTSMTDEERAEKIAVDYIKDLPGYKYYNGRQLKIISIVKNSGDGNYIIDARFIRDPTLADYAKEEPINVHLNVRKWKGDSYTFN